MAHMMRSRPMCRDEQRRGCCGTTLFGRVVAQSWLKRRRNGCRDPSCYVKSQGACQHEGELLPASAPAARSPPGGHHSSAAASLVGSIRPLGFSSILLPPPSNVGRPTGRTAAPAAKAAALGSTMMWPSKSRDERNTSPTQRWSKTLPACVSKVSAVLSSWTGLVSCNVSSASTVLCVSMLCKSSSEPFRRLQHWLMTRRSTFSRRRSRPPPRKSGFPAAGRVEASTRRNTKGNFSPSVNFSNASRTKTSCERPVPGRPISSAYSCAREIPSK
mmetsp:Transcript_41556/g.120386  ORF Transcript_41556/g.120386 Transcript_41556/m.120386 type:complete len:273 (-) Transcript_41556:495-1313(-)